LKIFHDDYLLENDRTIKPPIEGKNIDSFFKVRTSVDTSTSSVSASASADIPLSATSTPIREKIRFENSGH